jgi:hypothetical protein
MEDFNGPKIGVSLKLIGNAGYVSEVFSTSAASKKNHFP